MMRKTGSGLSFRRSPLAILLAAGLMTGSGVAQAVKIESDNPDVKMRLDTTVRYNAAWRMKDRDFGVANNSAHDENEYLFDKGDLVTNRIDVYSEFDYTYQERMGFRVAGSVWTDYAYDDQGKGRPGTAATGNYPNWQYTDYIKRYYQGPSGEFADAFVWANFGNALNVKVGRFATLWGSASFGTASANSIAVDMAPGDGQKQSLSPGATAKETTLPIAQTMAVWQFTDSMSLSGQVTHEWRPSRLPEGGTYFGVADAILWGPPRANPVFNRANAIEGDNGDISLAFNWRPESSIMPGGAVLGVYARQFSQKTPTWAANLNFTTFDTRAKFAQDVKLLGLSLDMNLFGAAFGAEISHRDDQPLNTNAGANTGPVNYDGAIGKTWHALANATWTLNQNKFFDTGTLLMELTYQRLDEVTDNPTFYKAKGYVAGAQAALCQADEILNSCSTEEAYHFALFFSPTWQQILPSWDMSGRFLYQNGLKGNAPTTGINEGAGLFLLGVDMIYQNKHTFSLGYTDFFGRKKIFGAAANKTVNGTLGNYDDRDVLQFTYNYTF